MYNAEVVKLAKVLTKKTRDAIPTSDFALPEQRRYPIEDESHARAALSMVSAHGTPEEQRRVRSAVARKWPGVIGEKTRAMLKESSISREQLLASAYVAAGWGQEKFSNPRRLGFKHWDGNLL